VAGWRRRWSPRCLQELDDVVAAARRRGLSWPQAGGLDLALPALDAELAAIADQLEHGTGLVWTSGLDVDRYSAEEQKILFHALGRRLGRPVFQSARGELLGEICDEGAQAGARRGQMVENDGAVFRSSRARAQSSALLRWHTDRTDVVALLCSRTAARGGISRIASAVAVHDEMLARRPDLAAELYRDLVRSNLGEEAGGAGRTYAIPVWDVKDGHFATHYSRTFVEAAQKLDGVTPLRRAQWQALDLLAEIAEAQCLEKLAPGDMQFLNNHVVYHARSAFEDDPGSGRTRLLYRLWLSMRNSRPLPDSYGVLFGDTSPGALRGGIRQAHQ
jgi:hypothetical protein